MNAKELKRKREAVGLTQNELGRRSGVSRYAIVHAETNRKPLSEADVRKIRRVLVKRAAEVAAVMAEDAA